MTDQNRPEDELVDQVLRPEEPLGEKRPEFAQRRPQVRRSSSGKKGRGGSPGWLRLLVWVLVLMGIGAGGWIGWMWYSGGGTDVDPLLLEDPQVAEPAIPAGDRSVVLVFPEWDASGFVTEERQISSRDRGGEDLLGIMQVLCRGPVISGAVSPFPEGTQATAAFFNPEDFSVVIDFSEELVTGHPGGSTAEMATLTTILRTVALNFPETRSCTILVGGAEVETLAGHLTMDRPFDPRRWL